MIQLPQRLVDRDGYGIAQIQASCFFFHRDPDTPVKVLLQKILRKALGFLSEKEVAVVLEISLCVAPVERL